jgi:N-methylhydantoinase A
MRYVGQSFQVDVRLPDAAIEAHDIAAMHAAFHEEHERIYSHADKAAPVEFVDLRMRVRGSMSIPQPTTPETSGSGDALKAVRSMRFHNKLIPEVRVFDRGSLTTNDTIRGPAVIEQRDATIIVPPEFVARVGAYGAILMTRS